MEQTDTAPTPEQAPHPAVMSSDKSTATLRDLLDELVLVFILVMFLKTFLVEHYKIPTGSMTPTLLGGEVAYLKTEDGRQGLAYWSNINEPPLLYVKRNGRWMLDPELRVDTNALREERRIHEEYDHVLVSRLAYWFRNPRRGDIVVFKVPASIWKPEAPIYIKRLVGEPGETLSFARDGRLVASGKPVENPSFFRDQHYLPVIDDSTISDIQRTQMETQFLNTGGWRDSESGPWKIDLIYVPKNEAYVFGDNSTPHGSWDSRYWGGVPLDNFKGKAFVRVWPMRQIGFLH